MIRYSLTFELLFVDILAFFTKSASLDPMKIFAGIAFVTPMSEPPLSLRILVID
jgi:hypothetical protein